MLINTSKFLEPASLTLDELLAADCYLIPDYQRDYSWGEEEIRQLWDDFKQTASRCFTAEGIVVSHPIPHFIGAVVLQVFPDQERRKPEIIDGQQRLVTISTLLSVLLEFTEQIGDVEVKKNWEMTLEQLLFTPRLGSKVARLTLARYDDHYQTLVCNKRNQTTREAYFQTIDQSERSVAQRIITATRIFHESIQSYIGDVGSPGT